MKTITNKMGLPESLVKAITWDDYTGGSSDLSATSLWKPARMVALEKQHAGQLTQDASEMIWVLMGKCIHEILRRADNEAVTEMRLVDDILGWKISGQFDRFVAADGLLQDYKITSAWSLVFDSRSVEWTKQLNTYAHLLRRHGHQVQRIEVVAILRDWSATEARGNPDYPQCSVQVVPIELLAPEVIQKEITERVQEHQRARIELPLCSEEEQWARPTTYALYKKGAKKALKVCKSAKEAGEYMADKKDLICDIRPGKKTRCESYCQVRDFCDQYRRESGKNSDDEP